MSLNHDAIRQRFAIGLARTGDAAGPETLVELSLAAMRSRFRRPASGSPAAEASRALPSESGALLPDALRPLLVRLCAARATDAIALAAAQALARSGLRLHPFDYAKLEDFVVRFRDTLGPTARAWAALVRPDNAPAELYLDAVTEENFAGAGRAQMMAFLAALRARNPARARSLIAERFAQENAARRADLLDVLQASPGTEDVAFLDGAATDRAASVREKAEALLARIPGTPAHAKRIEKIPDYVKARTGMLGRRVTITLTGLPDPARFKLFELFEGLRLDDICRVLATETRAFIAAAAEVGELDGVVLRSVVVEGRLDLLEHFAGTLKELAWLTDPDFHKTLGLAGDAGRTALAALCFVPDHWRTIPAPFIFERLATTLNAPLADQTAQLLLNSKAWREMLARDTTPQIVAQVDSVAPLIPRALSERFVNDVQAVSTRAALLHRFLSALPEN